MMEETHEVEWMEGMEIELPWAFNFLTVIQSGMLLLLFLFVAVNTCLLQPSSRSSQVPCVNYVTLNTGVHT